MLAVDNQRACLTRTNGSKSCSNILSRCDHNHWVDIKTPTSLW